MRIRSAAFITALNNELADRKRRISKLKKEREAEIYGKFPRIRELDESIRSIAFDMGKKAIESEDPSGIRALAESVIAEKKLVRDCLLREAGYTADYLDPQYFCEDCHDTGRIGAELCHCVVQLAVNTAFNDSGINASQNFSNFDLDLQKNKNSRKAMQLIYDYALRYANSFPNNERHDIVFFGPTGVGKTYLLNCIGGRVLSRGYSVLKINAHRLIQLTLDNLRTSPEERPDFIMPDLLIIDDLGTEPMIPNITVETLLSILSERQDLGKSTLFATNLEVLPDANGTETIQSTYGERFASRLMAPKNVFLRAVRTDNLRLCEE
ncbi:MAG: ATP-binding protein [Clostridia bacterium]|nr:ATP-binding protein [Clostridia bacterium]